MDLDVTSWAQRHGVLRMVRAFVTEVRDVVNVEGSE
jgi:hypothetical protein